MGTRKRSQKRQTLDEFVAGERARDPTFAKEYDKLHARSVKRLGRPPGTTSATREMRTRVPAELAERIVAAAQRSGRTVANWLLEAAKKQLAS